MDFDHSTEVITPIANPSIVIAGSGSFGVPVGDTASRPTLTGAGHLRWNTSLAALEVYNSSTWSSLGSGGGGSLALTVEDVTGTTYTFGAGDLGKIKRFTNAAGCTATIPASLGSGWNVVWERTSTAGDLTFAASGTTIIASNESGSLVASTGLSGNIIPEATDTYQISGALGTYSAGSVSTGTATINFGSTPTDEVVFTVSTALASTSKMVILAMNPAGTADHSSDEHAIEEFKLSPQNIVNGVSFDIRMTCTDKFGLTGTWSINWALVG